MASSSELYEEQKALIAAKSRLDSNVEKFLSGCSGVATKAKSIYTYCSNCNDTNLKECASSGGSVTQLVDGINEVISNVEAALSAADSAMQADIDELGRQAAIAAASEAAAAAAAKAAAAKVATAGIPGAAITKAATAAIATAINNFK